MKILAVAAFDPASVIQSHRDLMRAAGHDFRLAVVRAYTPRQLGADWVMSWLEQTFRGSGRVLQLAQTNEDKRHIGDLKAFIREADLIQVHLGIGMGDGDWASMGSGFVPVEDELATLWQLLGIHPTLARKPDVAFFHGSTNTWVNRGYYHNWCHDHEVKMAASTALYAGEWAGAKYLPPLVQLPAELELADRRTDEQPLMVAHTPTDVYACSTDDFLELSKQVPFLPRFGMSISHKQVWELKRQCHAGFDHLRGDFSVNTLENAALGLVPLFGLSHKAEHTLKAAGISLPPLHQLFALRDLKGLHNVTSHLQADPTMTRHMQEASNTWFTEFFNPNAITRRLLEFYR